MRYLVVLDPGTFIGAAYKAGNNDGMADLDCPVISCASVDMTGPFLRCCRDTKDQGGANHTVHIPYSAVTAIYEYAPGGERPIGFLPAHERANAQGG